MHFAILGPVEYRSDGDWRRPRGLRQQKLLAALLAEAGRPVSVPRLAEAVWDDQPPATAAEQIANGTSKLRAELNRAGHAPRIGHSPAGYHLNLVGHELDLNTFRQRVAGAHQAVARRDLADAVAALRTAIDLWRGPALAGLDGTYLRVIADRLDEHRVAALEDLGWLELRRANPDAVTGAIADLVVRYPFRERLVALQMLALSRAGRRSDALAAYRRLRTVLATHLGIDPQPELTDLHRSILRGEQPNITYWTTSTSRPTYEFQSTSPGKAQVLAAG